MSTFLLVHGAWLGGWFWGRVRNELHDAQQNVFAPTLTGLGERAHLLRPDIGLDAHLQDVLSVIEYEALHRVILVTHGYAGMLAGMLAARLPKKFHHVVYLDAVVPQDGETFCDVIGPEHARSLQESSAQGGEGWRVPFSTPLESWGITSEVDVRWTNYRMTPHPWKTMTDKARIEAAAPSAPWTFVRCVKPANPRIETSAQRARAAGWRYHELAAGHAAPVTAPRELARLLLAIHDE